MPESAARFRLKQTPEILGIEGFSIMGPLDVVQREAVDHHVRVVVEPQDFKALDDFFDVEPRKAEVQNFEFFPVWVEVE